MTDHVLELLRFLEVFLNDPAKAKLVWVQHSGKRRSMTVGSLMKHRADLPRMNEAYVQVVPNQLRTETRNSGLKDLIVHFSVSPSCSLWDSSQSNVDTTPNHRLIRHIQSLERANKFRKSATWPSVLEMTLVFETDEFEEQLGVVCELLRSSWSLVNVVRKLATIDIGGEWLFFPKSGHNPNVNGIHAYFDQDALSNWSTWSRRHNVSFEDSPNTQCNKEPIVVLNSTSLRKPAV